MAGNRSLGRLTLDLVAKIGGFTQGLSQAERVAQDRARRIERTFRGLKTSVTGIFAAIGGAALVRSIIRNTNEAEEAFALLDNAVEQSGGAAGRTTQQLAGMASELQSVTKFGDEAIMGAEQLLLRFQSIQDINFDRALKSTLDLATALGTDLESAAKLVGKALESPVKGLTQLEKSGVVLDKSQRELVKRLVETGDQAQAQQTLLDGLEQRYKGAAEAARNTLGGALTGLSNAFGDLLEAKDGLPGAVDSINELADLMNSEEVKSGFGVLTSGVVGVAKAIAEGAAWFAGFSKWVGESIAAQAYGPAEDDLVRTSEAIDALRKKIKDFESEGAVKRWLANRVDPESVGLPAGTADIHGTTLDNMREKLKKLEAQYESAASAAAKLAAGGGSGGPAPPPLPVAILPSDEFLNLKAKLEEQIALYGQVGEAAKIAYQIRSGQLEELSGREQQTILNLASQYDGIVQAAAAAKEQEQAQKQLTEVYESQADSLQRQLDLTAEATQLEQLRYELAHGALSQLTEDQKVYLEGLARNVDLQRERVEWESKIKSVIEETLTPLEQYQRRLEELNQLLEHGLDFDVYRRAVEQAQSQLEGATDKGNDYLLKAAEGTEGILADTLFGAMDGKIDNIGKSFLKMLKNLVAQSLAANLTKALFGGVAGGTGGGILSFLPGFATGGKFVVGGSGGVDSQLVSFWASPGEEVEITNPGSQASGYSAARSYVAEPAVDLQPRMNINIVNQIPTAAYQVERLSSGDVRIIAREEVNKGAPNVIADQLQNPNSRVSKSMAKNTTAGRQR